MLQAKKAPTGRSSLGRGRVLGLVVLFWGLGAGAVRANEITVAPGEVVVANNDLCSLREAIHNANGEAQVDNTDCTGGSGADVIHLAAGSTYVLPDEDAGDSGLPVIVTEMTIEGNGATIERDANLTCVLNGSHTTDQEFRILKIESGGDLTLEDLTLANGCADGSSQQSDGGAIFMKPGTLVLDRVTITGSQAHQTSGGLDTAKSLVTITDSTFSLNSSLAGGGGIGNGSSSVMTIERTTIVDNSSLGGGGGIGNEGMVTIRDSTLARNHDTSEMAGGGGIGNLGSVEIINSTISDNTSVGELGGGGIGNIGELSLESSTVAGNSATGAGGGGGIVNYGGIDIKNSIVAESTNGGDCVNSTDFMGGIFQAFGADLDTDGSCHALDDSFTQVTSGELALDDLARNGGPTETRALLAGSAAIDAAPDCTLLDDATVVDADQRGVARPQDGDGDGSAVCDVGAFEAQLMPVPALGATGLALLALLLAAGAIVALRRT